MAATEKSPSKGQAWFCTTGLPSDVVIEVGNMSFHLHKFPLMYRSKKLHHLITSKDKEQVEKEVKEMKGVEEEEGEFDRHHISLADFPGGAETFEATAKFCYGVKIELTASNVVPLRCAAEFLEMTDDISEDNLVSKTEHFLAQTVLRSLKDSVKALQSCDGLLLEMAEEVGITRRCVNSVTSLAASSSLDHRALFGLPVDDGGARRGSSRILWNGIDTRVRRRRNGIGSSRSSSVAATAVLCDSRLEDLSSLSWPVFKRLISAMKARDLSPDVIECSLISYAKRCIPGLSRSSRKSGNSVPPPCEQVQVDLLETVVENLPVQKSATSTNTRFIFGLLRTVNILGASDAAREALEKKIGLQLEQATLDDLLMPCYSYAVETLYDVDCVERMVGHFLEWLRERNCNEGGEEGEGGCRSPSPASALPMVGRLMDGYLSEIASDVNLHTEKFCRLAFTLPEQARVYDDGLYRAVDVYLKAHPGIPEQEREKVCSVMDCQKLTVEACTHAAQNERLPLRAVVQVLFFEQLQLRRAIAGSVLGAEQQPESGRFSRQQEETEGGGMWRSAVRDNQVLKVDMDSMRSRVQELEKECANMRKVIEKMDRSTGMVGGWGSVSKKFGCKFRTQVCDSHQRNMVDSMVHARIRRTEQST